VFIYIGRTIYIFIRIKKCRLADRKREQELTKPKHNYMQRRVTSAYDTL